MNRPLKLLALVGAFSLIPLMATIACPPPYCGDCYHWDGVECVENCWGCCVCCSPGNCACNDSYCSWSNPCYYCSGFTCYCNCDARVTTVSAGGPHCVGEQASVSAEVSGNRPYYCYISWSSSPAGAVSFSPNPSSDASTTLTFLSPGTGVTISASTSCPNGGATSPPFDIVSLSIDSDRDAACVGYTFTLTATTNPQGYASSVAWSAPGATPSTGNGATFSPSWSTYGTYTVYATLLIPSIVKTKQIVVASPTNYRISQWQDSGQGVLNFDYAWDSTSGLSPGALADLFGCDVGERVDYPGAHSTSWVWPAPWRVSTRNPTLNSVPATDGAAGDTQRNGNPRCALFYKLF